MYCRMVYVLNEIPFQEKFLRHLPPVFESDRGGAVLVKKEKFCNTPALRFTPAGVRPIIKYNKYNTGAGIVNKLKRCGIIFLSCMTLSAATTTVLLNGVCPYAVGGQTDNSSAGNSSTAAAEAPSITYDLMNSYSRVFDPDYYYNTYPDLQTAIGTDKLALFTHFYNSGMAEGRKGCAEFDVNVYKENNTDLQTAFGSDLRKYYEHYMNTGWAEGRTH